MDEMLPTPSTLEADLFDENNPRSLINIVWVDFKEILKRSRYAMPELFEMSETKMTREVDPDPCLRMVRMRFWQEYDRCQIQGKTMMVRDVLKGVCTQDYWKRGILPFPEKVAYLCIPPTEYVAIMEDLLTVGIEQLREILALPIKDAQGKINSKLIAEKIKIFQLLDLRVKGAVIQKIAIQQRIDQRIQNSNAPSGIDNLLENMSPENAEALDRALNKVQREIERAQNQQLMLPEPSDESDKSDESKLSALTLDVTHTSKEGTEIHDRDPRQPLAQSDPLE